MNEEMRDKIETTIIEYEIDGTGDTTHYAKVILSLETDTHRIAVIKKGEPPLLSDEEIRKAAKSINAEMVNRIMDGTAYDKVYPEDRAITKSQRSVCIEYYNETT